MKKIIKFIFPILFIILCACSPKNYFTEVNYKDVIENIDNKESFVLVIGRDDCPYCIDLIENIKKDINKEKEFVSYLKIKSGDKNQRSNLIEKFGDFDLVPYVIYIKNGEIIKTKTASDEIYEDFWNII